MQTAAQPARPVPHPLALARAFITPDRSRARPARLDLPEGRRIAATLSGGDIAAWRWGRGPAVLLVHGWEGSHHDMAAFVQPLLDAGLSPVALDLPAHGESDGATATIPDLARAIQRVADAAGPLAGLVAHSIGSAASTVALARGLRAGRIVLIGAPTRHRDGARRLAAAQGLDEAAWMRMERALIALGTELPSMDLPALAPGLPQPALFIHSRDDRVCAIDQARLTASRWPGARFVEVDGLGHNRILGDGGVIARTIGFLTEAAPTRH